MYKQRLNGEYVNGWLIFITLFAVLLIHGGCFYLPIPAIDLGSQKGVVSKKAIKSLRQGKSTRADVLLLLGDPDERHEQDRFFIYSWHADEAIFGFGYGYAGAGNYLTVMHFFCVEFDEGNRIRRFKHIKSGLFKSADKAQDEVYKWMHVTEQ